MAGIERWIWLDSKKYPQYQTTSLNFGLNGQREDGNFTVAEFYKEYSLEEEVVEAECHFSGDTTFQLYLNGQILANGPVNAGGDFLFNDLPCTNYYSSCVKIKPNTANLTFFARVKMMPCALNEYSRGHGGFMLWCRLRLKSGRIRYLSTDESWLGKRNDAYIDCYTYDQSGDNEEYSKVEGISDRWHVQTAPISLCTEQVLFPEKQSVLKIQPGEKREFLCEFDRIYAGVVLIDIQTTGSLLVQLEVSETEVSSQTSSYSLKFRKNDVFRGLQLSSIGIYRGIIENHSEEEAVVKLGMIEMHYPVTVESRTETSDRDLNLVLNLCRHTLKSCRQMMHLDSPQHCEPLACTGDYYIETLMTAMSFGDMSLAEFDVIRTADLLRMHDGRLFHTTYSLIWVMMLWEVYMFTGKKQLLLRCEDALILLLNRFETYLGENGLIETPPDYMFVDWLYLDGLSLHHPPKALGQTSLCAFYYAALKNAEKIFDVLKEPSEKEACGKNAERLRAAINTNLFDQTKRLYFDGLNTPTKKELLGKYMPQNTEKRYYLPHSNILCACFGICEEDTAKKLIDKVVNDKEWGICQPYFKHYLLEAVFRYDLCEKYTLSIVEEWKNPVKNCAKGLVEGFVKPEPGYQFDHSHAWGGTPLYSVPKALLGLEILEAGYKKIRLCPQQLGLQWAHIEVPTPYGMMEFEFEKGKTMQMKIPEEIQVELIECAQTQ